MTHSQRHAFLIMAHDNWYVLEKLMRLLDGDWIDIFLHIDKKSKDFNIEYFKSICSNARVFFTRRHNVSWGNETQVRAEMTLFRSAYKNGPYHYYHFLSGSDLPIKTRDYIYHFFEFKDCNYLTVESDVSPYLWRLQTYINVFRQTWLPLFIRRRLNVASEIVQYKLSVNRLKWLKRHYSIIGKGYNWCDLPHKSVEVLMGAASDIRRFCRFTHCSDEMYKQTVLLNRCAREIGEMAPEDIRMIEWMPDGIHPRVFSTSDLSALLDENNPCLFARKFDARIDSTVVDTIYSKLS